MSINEELSFTEYTLPEDTTDFIISFDRIGGSTDEVSILVNNTPIEDLVGYTVLQVNFSTWQVDPALPAGTVVRLARTTNLDKMVYVFTAGSKFIAKNVDDNFKQIQHSQQEIRDRQDKLEGDATALLLEINDVKVIAEQAAVDANEALEKVDDILNTGVIPAGMILTADGGNQQQFNDAQEEINLYGAKTYDVPVGGYPVGGLVRLDNGDIVKSMIPNNTNNPNENMTGWYNPTEFQRLLNFERISFTTLGIIPNTGDDLTLKINQALIAYRNLFIPNGDYLISSINIPANTVITTQGRGVRFIQKAASGEGTRVIKVVGSNVYLLPSISVKGNITTDPNEQNHAIYIQANATTGHVNNVNIGDVYAEDIRGDAVYFGQATGAQYKLTNVAIGNVSFDNVYRNGVSVVSCNGFNIKSVVGKRAGMMDIDIEANIGSGVCVNGYIGFVKGKCIGGIAQTQTDFVDNVIFDRVELSYTDYVNSTPEYPSYYKIPVLYRNIKSMTINELIIDGCDGYAISRIDGDAPLANTPLRIGKLTLRNACKVSNAENGIIKGGHVVIDYLDLDFSGLSGRSLFYAGSNWVVNKADVNFAASCNLFRSTANSKISRLTTKSTTIGDIFNGGANGVIEDSTANINRIFANASKGLMTNCNFTAITPFTGGDNHTAINTAINGSYYANGLTQYGYLNCFRMGVFHLWVGSDGKLRIKSGAPTSDTDGTIVGTQV